MSHSSTDDRTSDRVGRASTRGILYSIGEALSDDRARKDAKGLRIPVADDFFERGRPWAVPLTDEWGRRKGNHDFTPASRFQRLIFSPSKREPVTLTRMRFGRL
jgi:hypothetical protein